MRPRIFCSLQYPSRTHKHRTLVWNADSFNATEEISHYNSVKRLRSHFNELYDVHMRLLPAELPLVSFPFFGNAPFNGSS